MNDILSEKRITKKISNLEELNEELHCDDWETLLLGRSAEDMWNEFSSKLNSLTEEHTHTKTSIEYPSKPWIDNEVTLPSVQDSHGKLCIDHNQSVEVFASVFASSFSVEPDGPLPRITSSRSPVELRTISFSADDIEEHLLHLKTSSTPGPDGPTAFVLNN
ncbi:hypothetical protein HHI36_009785 [Cryptolaemus montrouzieri]|uniref:Uncharacterized protein n=1 Tax=Cryptolaemus montrouzieri TaxID=559131 RepID=A0ABD2MGT6_9CUCU